jgi:hypothetical protein
MYVFSIDQETAEMTFLVNDVTRSLVPEAQEPRRASNVVPVDLFLRKAFEALRGAFGDEGRTAEWTRGWGCRWMVDMTPVGGPVMCGFSSREKAIEYEIEWLNENFL